MKTPSLPHVAIVVISVLTLGWGQGGRVSAQDNAPAQPSQWVSVPALAFNGRSWRVEAGEDLQAVLDKAEAGDEIILPAGATFIGNFELPRFSGGNWVTVRSSALDQLPPNERVTAAHADKLPKLVSPNSQPALMTQAGAYYWRFSGIEFSVADEVELNYGIVVLGGAEQRTYADVPSDLVLERCYIHGNARGEIIRGVALNSRYSAVVDSTISDCHSRYSDAQAIAGWNGPGPFLILNNYLEASGENVLFGGADPDIPELVPSDIEFRHNHCAKRLSWRPGEADYDGSTWAIKNLFELKNARRVLIEDNLFENNWADAQNGFAILLTVRNQDGGAPWSTIEDVTFKNNVVRHVAGGVNLLGRDDLQPSQQGRRWLFRHNFWEDISPRWGENGRFLQISAGADVTFDDNVVMHTGHVIVASDAPNTGFVFINNQMNHNEYGVIGDGTGVGLATLEAYFPGVVFTGNTLAGGQASLYPPGNFFPATFSPL